MQIVFNNLNEISKPIFWGKYEKCLLKILPSMLSDVWYDLQFNGLFKKGKRKVQGVPQSQTAALPRPQEEEETDKSKQAQTEQTYEKH